MTRTTQGILKYCCVKNMPTVYEMFKKPCPNGKCVTIKKLPKHFPVWTLRLIVFSRIWYNPNVDKQWITHCKTSCSFVQCSNTFALSKTHQHVEPPKSMFDHVWSPNIFRLDRASVTGKCCHNLFPVTYWCEESRVSKTPNFSWSCCYLKPA